MRFWDRVRGFFRNQTYTTSDPRLLQLFGAPLTATGLAVTESSAMQVSAVYACVKLIAGTISSLPLDIYRRLSDGTRTRINEKDDLWWLLNEQPHARWTAAAAWQWMVRSELLWGNAFVWIRRDRRGRIVALEPLHPSVVQVDVDTETNRLRYAFYDVGSKARGADQDDILHVPGFGFDGRTGMSAIAWGARNGIGIALATDEFSGRFFGSGALSKHVLTLDPAKNVSPETVQRLREDWHQQYAGLSNAYRPIVLTHGMDVKELSLSAQDSQLLEARKFQVIDIARSFGVPPVFVGESEKTSSWGTGIEQMFLGFVKLSLTERLVRIEQEINRKLFRQSGKFVKFNLDELLRGDSASRAKFLRELVGGSQGPGILTQNEARLSEGYSPLEDGNALYDPKGTLSNDTNSANATGDDSQEFDSLETDPQQSVRRSNA